MSEHLEIYTSIARDLYLDMPELGNVNSDNIYAKSSLFAAESLVSSLTPEEKSELLRSLLTDHEMIEVSSDLIAKDETMTMAELIDYVITYVIWNRMCEDDDVQAREISNQKTNDIIFDLYGSK